MTSTYKKDTKIAPKFGQRRLLIIQTSTRAQYWAYFNCKCNKSVWQTEFYKSFHINRTWVISRLRNISWFLVGPNTVIQCQNRNSFQALFFLSRSFSAWLHVFLHSGLESNRNRKIWVRFSSPLLLVGGRLLQRAVNLKRVLLEDDFVNDEICSNNVHHGRRNAKNIRCKNV